MALARWGENGSDVYVWPTGEGYVCEHMDEESYQTESAQEMIDHLCWHRAEQHKVPQETLARLSAERDGVPYETEVELILDELITELEKVKRTDG